MENIYNIAQKIFTFEPQPANSIQLDLVEQSDMSILFEILSILIAECLEIQLPGIVRNNRNISTFIIKLKQYLQSFGFDFSYEKLEEDVGRLFQQRFTFQVDKLYKIAQVRNEFNNCIYIPGLHNSDHLEDFKLFIKVKEDIYKLNFKFYR